MLKERYDRIGKIYHQGVADERFMELLDYSLKTRDVTYRKLASGKMRESEIAHWLKQYSRKKLTKIK